METSIYMYILFCIGVYNELGNEYMIVF